MFTKLPRWMGFPSQIWVEKKFTYDTFLNAYNGKAPCFTSTFKYKDRNTTIVDCAVFDIDSIHGLTTPYKDTEKLKKFCDNNKIPYIIDFSGGKGFHFFMITKPELGTEKVRDKLYSIQLGMVNALGISAIDLPTIGRLRWLIRIPTTQYVRFTKGKNPMKISTENYCRYIPSEDFDKGLNHILTLITNPGEMPKQPKAKQSLDDIIKVIPKFRLKHRFSGNDSIELMAKDGILTPSSCAVGLPCLQKIANAPHPCHYDRIELACWLKAMGYRDMAIVSYIKSLKWTDYNYKDTISNVNSVKPRFQNVLI